MPQLKPNKYQEYDLTEQEEKLATHVSPLFMAFLSNKMASYALQITEFSYTDLKDGSPEQKALECLVRHEAMKAQLLVLEELFGELTVPEVGQQADENQPD